MSSMRSRIAGLRSTTVVAALVLAPLGAAAEPAMPLTCAGPFSKTADEAALVARFGRAAVVTADLDGAEGATERGTVIFPRDPARRVEVFWADPTHRRRPVSIRVRGRGGWLVPTKAGTQPIVVGASLSAVEAANGRAFTLIGFGWDMGGYGGGWRGGAPEPAVGGCSLSLRFDPDPKASAKALDRVSGDRHLSSDNPAVRAVAPTVSEISLEWPEASGGR